MANKKIFKTGSESNGSVTDPEALFHDLKGRSPEIKYLWSHQTDILRGYHANQMKEKDVAIELPTGAGKTLIGLLIGEFRRRKSQERIVYLCPTRQLARQVENQASEKYGIKAYAFVGPQKNYDPRNFADYTMGDAIAITTYSGIFNQSPRLNDANVLILDDAHASENYIANMWSLEITCQSNRTLHQAIIDLYKDNLPDSFVTSIIDDKPIINRDVDIVPGLYFRAKLEALYHLLNNNFTDKSQGYYAWQAIRGNLSACNIYISNNNILIRPLTPPSLTHLPFANANQRIYMSATLGTGGELERITGVRQIKRIPMPQGWDKRGSGRRLFLAPQISLEDDEAGEVLVSSMKMAKRSLILAPSQVIVNRAKEFITNSDINALGSADIDDSLNKFTDATNVALVLSRYDGLDLPGEDCRLLIFYGLPVGINLQENFFLMRLKATAMLRDRILTRFTQGVGRCTRSDIDFAIVMLFGRKLLDFILKDENRRILHPELQAELEFGIDNSKDIGPSDFDELCRAFLRHDADWKGAEEYISKLRTEKERTEDTTGNRLKLVVADEVEYQYALWNANYEEALKRARAVSDVLDGNEIMGYRGWWYYLAGDIAHILYHETKQSSYLTLAKDYFQRAGASSHSINWFTHLARTLGETKANDDTDELTSLAIESIENRLSDLNFVGKKFEERAKVFFNDINSNEYKKYHNGLKCLGELLGFHCENPSGAGAPDCVWSIDNFLHIAHEAKTEETENDPISIRDVKQGQGHENWIKANRPYNKYTRIITTVPTLVE